VKMLARQPETMASAARTASAAVTLDLDALGKAYDGTWAVTDLTLKVPAGALVALLGPSGCGKTTTLRMIAGLAAPDHGDVRIDGASVLDVPPERRGATMVFQHPTLFPHLDVAANVGFGLKMRGIPMRETAARVRAALAQVQLAGYERRRIGQLSGGQQQRVALARALVTRPRLLLLDEPLSSLDPSLRDEMRELIAKLHAEQGITTILVTHDRQEAMTLADRIAFLSVGRLQQYGAAPDLYERPGTVAVARFFGMANLFPATVRQGMALTALGPLQLAGETPARREMWVGVRPEHIVIGPGVNAVTGRVTGCTYLGLYQQITLRCDDEGHALTLLAPADYPLREGEQCTVSLPPERLCPMPLPDKELANSLGND
jgi:ABC-type Fe3+/spermidine/putrescine transport system ATPase subunit